VIPVAAAVAAGFIVAKVADRGPDAFDTSLPAAVTASMHRRPFDTSEFQMEPFRNLGRQAWLAAKLNAYDSANVSNTATPAEFRTAFVCAVALADRPSDVSERTRHDWEKGYNDASNGGPDAANAKFGAAYPGCEHVDARYVLHQAQVVQVPVAMVSSP
jgi:hypothetical protein